MATKSITDQNWSRVIPLDHQITRHSPPKLPNDPSEKLPLLPTFFNPPRNLLHWCLHLYRIGRIDAIGVRSLKFGVSGQLALSARESREQYVNQYEGAENYCDIYFKWVKGDQELLTIICKLDFSSNGQYHEKDTYLLYQVNLWTVRWSIGNHSYSLPTKSDLRRIHT